MTATLAAPTVWTAADVVRRFGAIQMDRIRTNPAPGFVTAEDVVAINDHEDRLFELIDGLLVEKTYGIYESIVAVEFACCIANCAKKHRLGRVLGADGMFRLAPSLIRIPDVSFIAMHKIRDGKFPAGAITSLVPDLAVEVLSSGNTKEEMSDKLQDYFDAGVRLVWYVDPVGHSIDVFTAVDQKRTVREGEKLDGGDVLPGFELDVRELFAEFPREA